MAALVCPPHCPPVFWRRSAKEEAHRVVRRTFCEDGTGAARVSAPAARALLGVGREQPQLAAAASAPTGGKVGPLQVRVAGQAAAVAATSRACSNGRTDAGVKGKDKNTLACSSRHATSTSCWQGDKQKLRNERRLRSTGVHGPDGWVSDSTKLLNDEESQMSDACNIKVPVLLYISRMPAEPRYQAAYELTKLEWQISVHRRALTHGDLGVGCVARVPGGAALVVAQLLLVEVEPVVDHRHQLVVDRLARVVATVGAAPVDLDGFLRLHRNTANRPVRQGTAWADGRRPRAIFTGFVKPQKPRRVSQLLATLRLVLTSRHGILANPTLFSHCSSSAHPAAATWCGAADLGDDHEAVHVLVAHQLRLRLVVRVLLFPAHPQQTHNVRSASAHMAP